MLIMRAPSGSEKAFEIPCSGEGIFVAINQMVSGGAGSIAYWNGTSRDMVVNDSNCQISNITVRDGMATVMVYNDDGSYDSSARVCFIPGNPLTSN